MLYLNNCDGTFTESLAHATGHTSRFSMGVDAADMNNDGRPDLFVGDMLPEREEVLKTSASSESYNLFNLRRRAGYQPQYARNTLQLNRGGGRFSEVGFLAGVHASDWSWAALFADLDNDGRKDLFVTNGVFRRPNDLDYINYVGNEANQAALGDGISARDLAVLQHMPQVPLPNHAFRNDGDLRLHRHGGGVGARAARLLERRRLRGPRQRRRARSGREQPERARGDLPQRCARELNAQRAISRSRCAATARTREGIGAKVLVKHRRHDAAARADADARLPVVGRSPAALRAGRARRASTR